MDQYRSDSGGKRFIRCHYDTNKSELESQATNIKELFTARPPRSIAEAIIKVKELTGIERSPARLLTFMKRHGFHFLKIRHIPAKVNSCKSKYHTATQLGGRNAQTRYSSRT